MRTKGVAAHSAYPEMGENAIYVMGHVLVRLEKYASLLRGTTPHPLLGSPSLSAGVIEGGEAVNIVPEMCMVEIDRRTLPGESTEGVLAGADPPHLAVSGMEVPSESTGVRLLSEAVAKVCGDAHVESAQYATDAGIYNGAGIPSVVFGPGDIAQAHTSAEWIDIESLHAAASVVRRLVSQT